MPFNQSQIIEQARLAFSHLRKAFEKQTKTIKDREETQLEAIEDNKKQLDNNQQGKNLLLLSQLR